MRLKRRCAHIQRTGQNQKMGQTADRQTDGRTYRIALGLCPHRRAGTIIWQNDKVRGVTKSLCECCSRLVKLAFHEADTDTDILARIVARMSACHSACHRNNFRKSRISDVSARILARMSVSVSRRCRRRGILALHSCKFVIMN